MITPSPRIDPLRADPEHCRLRAQALAA